jgi:hypothetical protein
VRERFGYMLFDGPNGNTLESRDFGVLQTFEAAEHEDISSTLGQLTQCVGELRDAFPA